MMEPPGEFIAYGYEKRDESGPAACVYVDNLGVITADLERTNEDLSVATTGFDGKGLVTHEQEATTGPATVLGATVDGTRHETRLTPKRRWRVNMAVKYALSRRAVPGWGWEILIGHLTFCFLVNRDALAVFRDIYKKNHRGEL